MTKPKSRKGNNTKSRELILRKCENRKIPGQMN